MNSLIEYLREQRLITENAENTIKASLPGAAGNLLQRVLKDPQLRSFALTWNFYSPEACNFLREGALLYMLVVINGHWKIPVGYFLLYGLCATERANLVRKCLEFVHQSDLIVSSITIDGTATNMSMCRYLDASLHNAEASHHSTESICVFGSVSYGEIS